MTTHAFELDQVDQAIAFVVAHGAEDRGQTISYSRLFDAAGLPAPQELHQGGESNLVSSFMEKFHHRCIERELPPLDALVVHVAGRRKDFPGSGYFRVNRLADPLSETSTVEQMVAATNYWSNEKDRCAAWGVRNRRRG